MTTTELIIKLQHPFLTVNKNLDSAIIFNIKDKIAFVISIEHSELQIYTIDKGLRVYIPIVLEDVHIKDGFIFFNKEETLYIII